MNAKSSQTTTTATAAPAKKHDDTLPIAAGGALALLAIGGAAVAMNRRRHEEDEWVEESPTQYEPAETTAVAEPVAAPVIHDEQPAIIAPSAFAWDRNRARTDEPMVEQERQEGETWVERAYRGPSPSNPSVSLKNRLKRAAFFDKRERLAAEGLAEPVDPTAGLPDAMVAERERELA